jgi:uncharacterized protein with HEPN domain
MSCFFSMTFSLLIDVVETALVDKSRSDFDRDVMVQLGIQRAIEIISEASRHIPVALTEQAPDIPWKSIRGMGNILRHEYHHVADDVIWDVIQQDLPPLKAAIEMIRLQATGGSS